MAETPDEILKEIEHKRNQLGENITQLESYVREKTDVRKFYQRSPWPFVGGAAFGGLLLAMLLMPDGKRTRSSGRIQYDRN